jgi:hypothetical protein
MLERLKAERSFDEASGSRHGHREPADLVDLGLATLRGWFEA